MSGAERAVLTAIISLLVSASLTAVIRRYAIRRQILDVPNARSSHATPVPRGGGLSFVLVFSGCLIALTAAGAFITSVGLTLAGSGAAVAAIGYLDDRRSRPAGIRFLVHLLAATWVVIVVGGVPDRTLHALHLRGVLVGDSIAILALTWATNLFNFMDGIDGIAAAEGIFVAVAGGWLGMHNGVGSGPVVAMFLLAACTGGFLIWNWPPARIFMGDVGSGYLGFVLIALGLVACQRGAMPIEVWSILGGTFLVDATVTLLRRAARGDRWFEAHRLHGYQHAARRWKSHLRVTLAVTAINIVWLLPWAWFAASRPAYTVWCVPAALVPLVFLALWVGAGRMEDRPRTSEANDALRLRKRFFQNGE